MEIDLTKTPQISNATVYTIFLHSGHLRDLKLNANPNITSDGFPNLTQLLRYSADEATRNVGLYPWFASAPTSRVGTPIRDSTIERPASASNSLLSPQSSVVPFGASDSLPLNPSTLLRPVTSVLEHLRMLDLTGCSGLTDIGVENIVTNAPRLRTFTLAKCPLLTDASLVSIAKLGKHLHYLHLAHLSE